MISQLRQSGHKTYGLQEFVCDTPEDLDDLPVDAKMGSTAFVISTSSLYMINSQGEWVEI